MLLNLIVDECFITMMIWWAEDSLQREVYFTMQILLQKIAAEFYLELLSTEEIEARWTWANSMTTVFW